MLQVKLLLPYIQRLKACSTVTVSPTTTVYPNVAAMAPNGVILAENMPVHVQGVLNGTATIGCVDNPPGSGKSNVYLDSSIAYGNPSAISGTNKQGQTPPNINGNINAACTSELGIVSDNSVIITDKPINPVTGNPMSSVNNSGITIDASIFCLNGGFTAENYDSRGADGSIYLVGALQAKNRQPVGTFTGSGTLSSGSRKIMITIKDFNSKPSRRLRVTQRQVILV